MRKFYDFLYINKLSKLLFNLLKNIYRANIVDVAKNSLIISLTGSQSKIDSFIALLDGFKITELARTGITGLARGAANLK